MLTKNPLVSIIVNNYNYEKFLKEAIDSACSQSYDNVEVIVVDDGSKDGSKDIICSYGDRITAVFKANGGQASAFNDGFSASSGDIILFLDADDFLFPNAVEKIVSNWSEDTAKVHFMLKGIDGESSPLGYSYPSRGHYLGRGDVVPLLLERGVYGVAPTSGNAISREALSAVMPIKEEKYRISADGYLAMSIPFYGKVVAIEELLGAYRVHGNNNWGALDGAKQFQSFVKHDKTKSELLSSLASAHGFDMQANILMRTNTHLRARIASLKLDRNAHPINEDSMFSLLYHGITSTWRYTNLTSQKRVVITLWFLIVSISPGFVARPVIYWLFAQESRPKFIKVILDKLRPMLSLRFNALSSTVQHD